MQVNPHKDVPLKVSTGEMESLSTIKRFTKKRKQMNKIKKTNTNKINEKKN